MRLALLSRFMTMPAKTPEQQHAAATPTRVTRSVTRARSQALSPEAPAPSASAGPVPGSVADRGSQQQEVPQAATEPPAQAAQAAGTAAAAPEQPGNLASFLTQALAALSLASPPQSNGAGAVEDVRQAPTPQLEGQRPGEPPGAAAAVAAGPQRPQEGDASVGLVYDKLMAQHQGPPDHVERPLRVTTLMAKLESSGLAARCTTLRPRKATTEELLLAHTAQHIAGMDRGRRRSLEVVGATYENVQGEEVKTKPELRGEPHANGRPVPGTSGLDSSEGEEGDDDTLVEDGDCYYSRHTAGAARMAAGCTVQAVEAVVSGAVRRAFAVVRPPGHHAECDRALGFCFYNNVVVAALRARQLGVGRVLVLDWDVHHGNGIQDLLYSDPRVLYVSLHRGNGFYPGTGFPQEAGAPGAAQGANLNVVWPSGRYGDADYLAAFDLVIEPVVRQFDPELVIVSAGYDAVVGDPLGGQNVTPEGFAHMTERLAAFAGGRLVLALEGGYNVRQTAECAAACVQVLLGGKAPELEGTEPLRKNTGAVLFQTVKAHAPLCDALRPLGDPHVFAEAWAAYELAHSLGSTQLTVEEEHPQASKR